MAHILDKASLCLIRETHCLVGFFEFRNHLLIFLLALAQRIHLEECKKERTKQYDGNQDGDNHSRAGEVALALKEILRKGRIAEMRVHLCQVRHSDFR